MATRRRAIKRRKSNPSSGSSLITWGLVAAGAYLLYKEFVSGSTVLTTGTTGTTGTTTGIGPGYPYSPNNPTGYQAGPPATQLPPITIIPPVVTPPSSAVTVSPGGVNLPVPFQTVAGAILADANFSKGYSPTVAQMLVAAMGGNGANPDQWNYYWSQLSGQPQTFEMLNDTDDRTVAVPVSVYMGLRSAAGLSGMGPITPIMTLMANQWRSNWG